MEILGYLFGNETKVKLIRLFLLNPGKAFSEEEIVARVVGHKREVKKMLGLLLKIKIIRATRVFLHAEVNGKGKGRRVKAYVMNERFSYLRQLQKFLLDTMLIDESEMVRKITQVGKVKLIILAGVFIQNWDSRIDMLVVGDKLKETTMKTIIKKMEAEIGRDLHYATLETSDFHYRHSIGDRLIRDILDFKHLIILDRFGLKQK